MDKIKSTQNKLRTFLFDCLPMPIKEITLSKLDSLSITDNHVNNFISGSLTIFSLMIYNFVYKYPRALSSIFAIYPIHLTIEYIRTHRPLLLEQKKLLMTWIYFALWDNLTYFTNSYPLIRIAGYIGIFMKNYDDTNKRSIGDYIIIKHEEIVKSIKGNVPDTKKTEPELKDSNSEKEVVKQQKTD